MLHFTRLNVQNQCPKWRVLSRHPSWIWNTCFLAKIGIGVRYSKREQYNFRWETLFGFLLTVLSIWNTVQNMNFLRRLKHDTCLKKQSFFPPENPQNEVFHFWVKKIDIKQRHILLLDWTQIEMTNGDEETRQEDNVGNICLFLPLSLDFSDINDGLIGHFDTQKISFYYIASFFCFQSQRLEFLGSTVHLHFEIP